MNVPTLNRLLLLEASQRVPDGAGGFTLTWQELGSLWACISARGGRETERQGSGVSQVRYTITVRGAPFGNPERPRPDQRFREGARIYHIKAVAEADRQGRYLICFATEERAI